MADKPASGEKNMHIISANPNTAQSIHGEWRDVRSFCKRQCQRRV